MKNRETVVSQKADNSRGQHQEGERQSEAHQLSARPVVPAAMIDLQPGGRREPVTHTQGTHTLEELRIDGMDGHIRLSKPGELSSKGLTSN